MSRCNEVRRVMVVPSVGCGVSHRAVGVRDETCFSGQRFLQVENNNVPNYAVVFLWTVGSL